MKKFEYFYEYAQEDSPDSGDWIMKITERRELPLRFETAAAASMAGQRLRDASRKSDRSIVGEEIGMLATDYARKNTDLKAAKATIALMASRREALVSENTSLREALVRSLDGNPAARGAADKINALNSNRTNEQIAMLTNRLSAIKQDLADSERQTRRWRGYVEARDETISKLRDDALSMQTENENYKAKIAELQRRGASTD